MKKATKNKTKQRTNTKELRKNSLLYSAHFSTILVLSKNKRKFSKIYKPEIMNIKRIKQKQNQTNKSRTKNTGIGLGIITNVIKKLRNKKKYGLGLH